jgi:hypothetical protein
MRVVTYALIILLILALAFLVIGYMIVIGSHAMMPNCSILCRTMTWKQPVSNRGKNF